MIAEVVEVTADRRSDSVLCDSGKQCATRYDFLRHQASAHKMDALHCSIRPEKFCMTPCLTPWSEKPQSDECIKMPAVCIYM